MSKHEFIEPDDDITEPDIPVVDDYEPQYTTEPPVEKERKIDWGLVALFVGLALIAGAATAGALIWGDGWGNPGTDHPVWIPIT